MRFQGRIAEWKDDKGYGFIVPNGGGDKVFVHIKAFAGTARRPAGNELVNYTLGQDAQGRARATDVAFARRPVARRSRPSRHGVLMAVPVVFLAVIGALAVSNRIPAWIPLAYLALSVVAYVAYQMDKAAARRNRWRTPENSLHLLALLGGWPGALAAQQILRHKSSKPSFQIAFWVTVVANCACLFWLTSGGGGGRILDF